MRFAVGSWEFAGVCEFEELWAPSLRRNSSAFFCAAACRANSAFFRELWPNCITATTTSNRTATIATNLIAADFWTDADREGCGETRGAATGGGGVRGTLLALAGAPHLPQNLSASVSGAPHFAQVMCVSSPASRLIRGRAGYALGIRPWRVQVKGQLLNCL